MAKSREMEFVMEKKVLQRLPGWVKRMDEVAGNFSNPGFHGLVIPQGRIFSESVSQTE